MLPAAGSALGQRLEAVSVTTPLGTPGLSRGGRGPARSATAAGRPTPPRGMSMNGASSRRATSRARRIPSRSFRSRPCSRVVSRPGTRARRAPMTASIVPSCGRAPDAVAGFDTGERCAAPGPNRARVLVEKGDRTASFATPSRVARSDSEQRGRVGSGRRYVRSALADTNPCRRGRGSRARGGFASARPATSVTWDVIRCSTVAGVGRTDAF
jgi:hypothetical protein